MNQYRAISKAEKHGWVMFTAKFVKGRCMIVLNRSRGKGQTGYRIAVSPDGKVETLY